MTACIACGHEFASGETRMRTELGDLCIDDMVPAYRVAINGEVHLVTGWTADVIRRINHRNA